MSIRKLYLFAGLAVLAIAVYGSLVPLNYRPRPWEEAMAVFSEIRYLQLSVDSRADFVSNILLFVPLGFFFLGASRVDRRGAAGAAAAAVAVTLACAVLSLAIEFAQVFFPPRTVSINDIVAETTGAGIGVVMWALAGAALTDWGRRFLACRERGGLAVHLLALYAALFTVSAILPLDLTISLSEIAAKYREGRIVLVPFSHAYGSPMLAVWDFAADVLLHLPLGALALVGWTEFGGWRRPSHAFALACSFVILVETAQLFVFSRFSDVTDLFVGAAGVALGIALTRIVAVRQGRSDSPSEDTFPLWSWLGAFTSLGVLVAYHWYPFDFVVNRTMVTEGLSRMFAAPFSHYYWGSEFQAFTQISRKLLLALPLGVLMRLAAPASASVAIARLQAAIVFGFAFLLLFAIEAGQVLLPGRVADITDVFIGEAGVMLGYVVCGALSLRAGARQVESASW